MDSAITYRFGILILVYMFAVVLKFDAPAPGIEGELFVATLHASKCNVQGGVVLFNPYLCGYGVTSCSASGAIFATTILEYAGGGVFTGSVIWPVHIPDDMLGRIDLDDLSVVINEDTSAFALRMACADVGEIIAKFVVAIIFCETPEASFRMPASPRAG